MNMENKEDQLELEEEDVRPEPKPLTAVENFYERFRDVPLRYLDIFIGICAAALVVVVILGMLKGRGFF